MSKIRDVLLRFPGVARVRLTHTGEGRLEAHVLGWDKPMLSPDTGPFAELAKNNPDELQFLHDEIFIAESYLQGGIVLREDAVVFDVGANIGIFSLFVGARCPSAEVFAFEPVPDVFTQLRTNVERHGVSTRLFEIGLSDREQQVTFNFYPDLSIMSCRSDYADLDNETELVKKYVANARETGPDGRDEHLARVASLVDKDFDLSERRCQLRRLSAVIDEAGVTCVDLLKIDVQRSELDVLKGLDDRHWALVRQIVMEVHDEVGTPTEGRVEEVRALLMKHGFEIADTEVDLLRGAGRYTVQAVRPGYENDPRPVIASVGSGKELDEATLRDWLADRLPEHLVPRRITLVDMLPSVD
ncbi:FkbM family methyltransferase [Streptomyces sp. NPDC088116]|uniref:FkbM family methyltransferase n=1 Tax=Streptomyces sp. NPDC088116 TaxID=3365825 RepID=UPI00380CC1F2